MHGGAHVVYADEREDRAVTVRDALLAHFGAGVGVAGTGISGCGPVVGIGANMNDPTSRRRVTETAVAAFGGADEVVMVRRQ